MEFVSIKSLELITILAGFFTVGLSLTLAYKFKKVKNTLSKALSLQLIGEGFIGFVVVLFAVLSWIGLYGTLSAEEVIFLRWLIFGVGAATSINLYLEVKNIEDGKDGS